MGRRKWFRDSKAEIWEQFADQLGGRYEGKAWKKNPSVTAWHHEWEVVMDKYVVSTGKTTQIYTRIRAPYVNRDDFTFRIYRRNIFSGIGKRLGLKDIEVGHPQFDHDFIIQGNDEKKLRMMFDHGGIRDLISFQPNLVFRIKEDEETLFQPKFPPDVNQLYYQSLGMISDMDRLHDLFELFAITLDHLCAIGTAYEDDPSRKW